MSGAGRRRLDRASTRQASRRGWDVYAAQYQADHGEFLRDAGFVWCPEGLDEADVRLLGPVAGRRVLEVGCGAAQCSRWLATQGATVVGVDLSAAQLRHSRRLDGRTGAGVPDVPVVQADAEDLPFTADSFDLAFSAFGAVPFVADAPRLMREVARVLRPSGRWVFSLTHPVRWCFPDDPGEAGLVAAFSYWDRRAYVESDDDGEPEYVEHHRTLGDLVRALRAAGLVLDDLLEPEWPEGFEREWGGWSPQRGAVLPGTAIFCCHRPPALAASFAR